MADGRWLRRRKKQRDQRVRALPIESHFAPAPWATGTEGRAGWAARSCRSSLRLIANGVPTQCEHESFCSQ